jgi:DNA-binding transcriptional LysR family regulator
VTTPGYLDGHAPLTHPAQLAEHTFVTMPPSLRKPVLTFRVGADELAVPLRHEVVSNNPVFNREMVLQGFGIGILPTVLAQRDIELGRLVTVLDGFEIVDGAIEIRLAYTTRTLLPAKVRAFIDHATGFYDQAMRPLPVVDY